MEKGRAFKQFAPTILKTYHRNGEAFWKAIMAPFLDNQVSLLAWLQTIKVDVGLLSAFKGLDNDAQQTLKDFCVPFGLDVTTWENNRAQYLKDAYPVFAFLAVWLDEVGLSNLVENFSDILRAGIFAVAGYGILDANVDSDNPSPVEMLTAQALIAEYETLALRIFGISKTNLEIMHKMRTLFLAAEIKEKSARHKTSPYRLDDPKDLGTKGANSVTPFMLSLEQLGRASQIEDYWEVFLLFGAVIQMIDDWEDLEKDLTVGHYSFVTLGFDKLHEIKDSKEAAQILRADEKRVQDTYVVSKEMIARSRTILAQLNETILVRLVDVTEARLDSFFRKELKMA